MSRYALTPGGFAITVNEYSATRLVFVLYSIPRFAFNFNAFNRFSSISPAKRKKANATSLLSKVRMDRLRRFQKTRFKSCLP